MPPYHSSAISIELELFGVELYEVMDTQLGRGAYAVVKTAIQKSTGNEYAVKIIEKRPGQYRQRVIKEIETFHACAGHPNVVQLIEFFETADKFYLVQ